MSKVQEIIVSAVLPIIKAVGKAELVDVLNKIKEHNTPEVFHNTLQALYSSFTLLNEVALQTSTKIDDGLVGMVLEAVKEVSVAAGDVIV